MYQTLKSHALDFSKSAAKIPTFRDISSAYDVYFHDSVIFTFLSLFLHSGIGRFAAYDGCAKDEYTKFWDI